ncbi:Uncharacterized protein APZ42_017095 [Daphnia magna]|uniref:Uncharacterized protein n=1 Tax=Daphnia magna TaxID=35525 RepID=A0A162CKX2_9CRUS|nr:Uncharacterized protein APZ42_017095 [Daphnia magna]
MLSLSSTFCYLFVSMTKVFSKPICLKDYYLKKIVKSFDRITDIEKIVYRKSDTYSTLRFGYYIINVNN